MISPHADIFDRACQRQRRVRAAALGPSTFLIDRVAEDLSDRLAAVLRRFELVLDLGTPTDAARRARSEERRVGKECRTRREGEHRIKQEYSSRDENAHR